MEIDKNERIKKEIERISCYFEEMPENKRSVIIPLIQNSAFMKVTLEDLQDLINEEGVIDQYKNGENQYGQKQSATLQSYNALVKNYASVTKTLFQSLPYMAKKPAPVPFTWEPEEKTPEEIEEERRRDEERQERINREIREAAEMQKREREAEQARKAEKLL